MSNSVRELFDLVLYSRPNAIETVNRIRKQHNFSLPNYQNYQSYNQISQQFNQNGIPTGFAVNIEDEKRKYKIDDPNNQRVFKIIEDIDNKIENLNKELDELNNVKTPVNKSKVLNKINILKTLIETIEKFYPIAEKIDKREQKDFTMKKDTLIYWLDRVVNKLPKTINNMNRVIEKYAYYNSDKVKNIKQLKEDMYKTERIISENTKSKVTLFTKISARIIYFINRIIDNINYKGNPDLTELEEIDPRYGKKPKMSEENEAIYDYALEHPYDPNNVSKLENTIKEHEKFKPYVYDDKYPNKELKPGDKIIGYPTIGYGFRDIDGVPVKPGKTKSMSKEEADAYLHRLIMNRYGKDLNNSIKVPITQNQYDALLSLIYNIGNSDIENRTIIKLLNSGDYIGAKKAFLLYIKSQGEVNEGLINRRKSEQKLFMKNLENLFK